VADASVDQVLSTWTLSTNPDAMRALGEVRRVLRPGGAFRFVEHGLAPDQGVARLQQLFTRCSSGRSAAVTSTAGSISW
jgi:ubiquinone/menaquinone biosynthesis C-methylase UbiE